MRRSSTGWPGIPLTMHPYLQSASDATRLSIETLLIVPTGGWFGPRARLPSRMKIGDPATRRIVMFDIATSSMWEPSTLSIAMPMQSSKTQLAMAMFLKSPFDSVPSFIRPMWYDL